MWHWILDAAGAVIIASVGYFVGKDRGWDYGYRDAWDKESSKKVTSFAKRELS
jgi:hypothetical protein